MFEKLGQAAEDAALRVSRRAFVGRLARWAAGAAAGIAGLLIAGNAHAAPGPRKCCYYSGSLGGRCGHKCVAADKSCPPQIRRDRDVCSLFAENIVSDCRQC
jgi:hypothetical protein